MLHVDTRCTMWWVLYVHYIVSIFLLGSLSRLVGLSGLRKLFHMSMFSQGIEEGEAVRQCVPRWNCVVASWKLLSWLPGREDTATLAQAGCHRHTIASLLPDSASQRINKKWHDAIGVFNGSSYAHICTECARATLNRTHLMDVPV